MEKKENIIIKDIPIVVATDEIIQYLKSKSVSLVTDIRYSNERDPQVQLTSFKNGDRYTFATGPISPILQRNVSIYGRQCRIFHDGQFQRDCKSCGARGHRVGSPLCDAYNAEDNVVAYSNYQLVLSKLYASPLKVYDQQFSSLQQAWLWEQAIQLGDDDLANKIMNAEHAGQASRLAKQTLDEEKAKYWEINNVDIMKELLQLKAEQCSEYKTALIENKKILAAAIRDPFWGTALPHKQTESTKPDYWPGKNMLGALQMELREQLQKIPSTEDPQNSQSDRDITAPSEEKSDSSINATAEMTEPDTGTDGTTVTEDAERPSGNRTRETGANTPANRHRRTVGVRSHTPKPRTPEPNTEQNADGLFGIFRKRKPTASPPEENLRKLANRRSSNSEHPTESHNDATNVGDREETSESVPS